jgi:hypothetical protein
MSKSPVVRHFNGRLLWHRHSARGLDAAPGFVMSAVGVPIFRPALKSSL